MNKHHIELYITFSFLSYIIKYVAYTFGVSFLLRSNMRRVEFMWWRFTYFVTFKDR